MGMMLPRIGALGLVSFLLVATTSHLRAQELDVYVSADSVTVGERFYVSVVARHEFAADPVFPQPGDSLVFGDVEVLAVHARDGYRRGSARIDSVVYEVATFALDTALVAPIPVLFRAGEDTFTVRTPEVFVPVASLVPENAEGIRDLAPILEFPAPIWPYVAGALALLLLAAIVAFLVWRRRRRPAAPPAVDTPPALPHDEALQRLSALENVDLTRREAIKPFYVELSDILRQYLARRIHVNAMEETTAELIREIYGVGSVPSDEIERLKAVLSVSDLVKFADVEPLPEQGRRVLEESRGFIHGVERALAPAESPQTDA